MDPITLTTTPDLYRPDALGAAFKARDIKLGRDHEGDLVATITCPKSQPNSKRGVLYVHGYTDYFFQEDLARFYADAGVRFYGLDLRRCGRSIRPYQIPNYSGDVSEYFEDLDRACELMRGEGVEHILLNGHSTGGLIAALYAHRERSRGTISALFLNSPFLEMPLPLWQRLAIDTIITRIGKVIPNLVVPGGLSPLYAESVHVDYHGEWRFDTKLKPIAGFPARAGWLRAIRTGQIQLQQGLAISVPILLMFSENSVSGKQWTSEYLRADSVLNVADIDRYSNGLGHHLTKIRIDGGMHDLVLSATSVRARVYDELLRWMQAYLPA
jgi:alpha-beta hydrolase superfamily lysophospholipase